jgi:hypothetical protein
MSDSPAEPSLLDRLVEMFDGDLRYKSVTVLINAAQVILEHAGLDTTHRKAALAFLHKVVKGEVEGDGQARVRAVGILLAQGAS